MLSRLILMVFGLAALWPIAANAERRVALVIGNSAYQHATALRNPGNDANDVAEALKKVGFEVQLGIDLDQQGFARTIEQFARTLDDAEVGLFFYAGHGVQMNDKNYLVSVNAKLENEFLLSSETIELDAVVRLMESKVAVNLVFLDACRNNPLAENLRRSLTVLKRSAQLGRGLARMEPTGRDTLIAFSAAPGQEAADGSDRNSPFTAALLRHIPKPGLEVSVMLKDVAADVRRDTRNNQRPQQLSDMTKAFYFAKLQQAEATKVDATPAPELLAKPAPAPIGGTDDYALDMAFWNAAQSSNDCDAVRAYMHRFPKGVFIELAKLSERRLCVAGRKVTIVDPAASSQTAPPTAVATLSAPSVTPAPSLTPAPPPAPTLTAPSPVAPAAIAALPEVKAASGATQYKPTSEPSRTDMTRTIQLELYRLGCGSNEANGNWTPATREGLRKFNKVMHAKLDLSDPSSGTIAVLQNQSGRVCPVQCGRGLVARGDTCVAVAKPKPEPRAEPRRKERRVVERRRAPRAAAESAEPAPQQAPVATSGPPMMPFMFMGGFGGGFRRH
ncbi:MAG TPA: caspase domain-containing protein [Xanthobacteraceae bacterium]|nr:caspase domain-containing protein [Xanthobacteraceae bacterium]